MNCMKCGRETAEEQVFCTSCLEEMERYPVKPGTVVHIPNRAKDDEIRKIAYRRKPMLSVSEQLVRLEKKLLWARIALAVMLILCGLLSLAVGRMMTDWDVEQVIGQNYSIEEATEGTEVPTATAEP